MPLSRFVEYISESWYDRQANGDLQQKIFLPSSHVQDLLNQCFYTTKSIPDLFSSLYIEITTINSLVRTTLSRAIPSYLQPPDSVLNMLPHLPLLHLSLVISAARLDAIHNATVVTFSLVYNHYAELVSRARLQASAAGSIAHSTKLWNRDIAAGAWEDLAEWEIILPTSGKGVEGGQTKLWRCDIVLEEITGAVGGGDAVMNEVLMRWCKEI
jgi:Origin recognition complex (ORC) subunit 4 C-terminus